MENELMKENQMENVIQQIKVIKGNVVFGAYRELKRQATDLAEQIANLEVTEDNVKISKKLLAEVNKRVNTLEDKRKEIKNTMLEPYKVFEDQVKEIVGIVKDADAIVRNQVKAMEEKEREAKEKMLWDLWHKRIKQYSFQQIVPFLDFAQARHLNKTVSIDAVEKEMVQFLEKVDADLKVINQLNDVQDHVNAYLNTYDLGQAMIIVKQEKERKEQITKAMKKAPASEKIGWLVSIQIHNEKELKLLEMILQENDFEYTTEKVIL
jgi:Protein of unknown function (DUF1351)